MVAERDFRALGIGDVFYAFGVRYIIDKIAHFTTTLQNTQYSQGYRARVECHTVNSREYVSISHKVFMNFAPYFVDRITKKDRIRRAREYSPRKNYPFVRVRRCEGTQLSKEVFEYDDCTVRALSLASGVPYDTAHTHMEQHGRVARKGCSVSRAYRAAGFDYTLNHTNMNLGNLVKSGKLPHRCILVVNRHVCAVVDGTVIDGVEQGSRKRVYGWWHHRGPRPTIENNA